MEGVLAPIGAIKSWEGSGMEGTGIGNSTAPGGMVGEGADILRQ